ncbi:cutinase family protein [Mumia zhuanghuii]|uniref:Cutinase family protein n=2 Tax=Mumia TaxID=1546255 RepID=A0ABW1QHM8_9ACTN|nr:MULTISPECIES: cutinase family protein [Mumia]KAA1418205.1 cutinase family protein [Mumia zhuanghuii]
MIGSRRIHRAALGAVAATMAASGIVAANAPAANAVTCRAYTVIGVRGTADGERTSMGTRLPTAVAAFRAKKGTANVTSDYVYYPAAIEYIISMRDGRNNLKAKINTYLASCSTTKIVLFGYSQGAHVVGDVVVGMTSAQRARLHGIGLIGDPMFNPALRGKVSKNSSTRGGIMGRRASWPTGVFVYNVCNTGDQICANSGTNVVAAAAGAPHQQYTTTTYSPVSGTSGAYAIGSHVATRS